MKGSTSRKSVLGNVGWPVFWGISACVIFYALVHQRVIESEIVSRYFATHQVQYFEMALFCIGIAAVLLRVREVLSDMGAIGDIDFADRDSDRQSADQAGAMITSIRGLPSRVQRSLFVRRLVQALEFVTRKGDAAGLDEELKHLSDLDAVRQQEQNALVRIIIWATPMLGFLGTVIGITLALGDLSPQALVSSPESAMEGLLAGLAVAFDTTALALVLAMILMFCQYVSNQFEAQLLEAVDERVSAELVGRFHEATVHSDPNVSAIKSMADQVMETTTELVKRQAIVWEQSITDAQKRWNRIAEDTGEAAKACMKTAIRETLHDHAVQVERTSSSMSALADKHWSQLQQALTDNARLMQLQQNEITKQGDVMLKVLEASADVTKLQDALNNNLASLAATSTFENAIVSLTSSISVLNAKLADREADVRSISLYPKSPGSRAA